MEFRTWRLQLGLSQKQFAELLEIPVKTLCKWEYGERKCPPYVLKYIGYYLTNEGYVKMGEKTNDCERRI